MLEYLEKGSTPVSLKTQPHQSLLEDFLASAVYESVQQPVQGVAQLLGGDNLEKEATFMEAPQAAPFGSAAWHAQTLGSAVGFTVQLGLEASLLKSTGLLGEGGSVLSRSSAIGYSLKESAITGFVSSAIFKPTAPGSASLLAVLGERSKNGVGGAVTFAGLTASSLGLGALAEGAIEPVSALLRNPIANGVLSGIPGGFISTEYDSVSEQGKVATRQELAQSIYSMSLVGGAFGLKGLLAERTGPLQDAAGKYLSRTLSATKEFLGQPLVGFTPALVPALADGMAGVPLSVAESGARDNVFESRSLGRMGNRNQNNGRYFENGRSGNFLPKESWKPKEKLRPTVATAGPVKDRQYPGSTTWEQIRDIQKRYMPKDADSGPSARAMSTGRPARLLVEKEAVEPHFTFFSAYNHEIRMLGGASMQSALEPRTDRSGALRILKNLQFQNGRATEPVNDAITEPEAAAILSLQRSEPQQNALIDLISRRGPVAARAAEHLRWGPSNDFTLASTELGRALEKERMYVQARDLLNSLSSAPANAEDAVNERELTAVRVLRSTSMDEYKQLEQMLGNRGPLSRWIVRRVHDEFLLDVPEFGNALALIPKPVSKATADSLKEHASRTVPAIDLVNELRARAGKPKVDESAFVVTAPNNVRAGSNQERKYWLDYGKVDPFSSSSRLRPPSQVELPVRRVSETAAEPDTMTLREANAFAGLQATGELYHLSDLQDLIGARGPIAEYVVDKVRKVGKDGSEILPSYTYDSQAVPATILPEQLEKWFGAAPEYVKAVDLLYELHSAEALAKKDNLSIAPQGANRTEILDSVTLPEAQALKTLLSESSTAEASTLLNLLVARGPAAAWMTNALVKLPSPMTEADIARLKEGAKIDQEFATLPLSRIFGLRPSDLAITHELSLDEAMKVASLRMRLPSEDRSIELGTLISLAKSALGRELSAQAALALHDHINATDPAPELSRYSAADVERAARTWAFAPELPFSLARDLADLPFHQRARASAAWSSFIATEPGAKRDLAHWELAMPQSERELFKEKLSSLPMQSRTDIIRELTQKHAIPAAIEQLHSSLTQQEASTLAAAVWKAKEPFKFLLGLKSSAFSDVLSTTRTGMLKGREAVPERRQAFEFGLLEDASASHTIMSLRMGDADRQRQPPDVGPSDREVGNIALRLALIFKGGANDWLNAQNNLKRSLHDATYWLPLKPAEDLQGLGRFLLQNSDRALPRLEVIAGRWSEVDAQTGRKSYDDVVALLLSHKFQNLKDVEFGKEAGEWGISPEQYPELERRYIKSKDVPVPFPLLANWTSGELTGRFIPRDDPRGLFLGQHTNCCQHPSGHGRGIAWYGQESPRAGFFVVEDKQGNIVAQSATWISNGGGVCFDNCEAKGIGQRMNDVQRIYEMAASDLAKEHPIVTLGTAYSDLQFDSSWKSANGRTLKLPTDFSGHTDAHAQVILAKNQNIAYKRADGPAPSVRGALSSDLDQIRSISAATYPAGDRYVSFSADSLGLLLHAPGGKPVGYALYEPQQHYISDLAVLPGTDPMLTRSLISQLMDRISHYGGTWSADCRESTSYNLLKRLEKRGVLQMLEDTTSTRMIGDDPVHHVVFKAA